MFLLPRTTTTAAATTTADAAGADLAAAAAAATSATATQDDTPGGELVKSLVAEIQRDVSDQQQSKSRRVRCFCLLFVFSSFFGG